MDRMRTRPTLSAVLVATLVLPLPARATCGGGGGGGMGGMSPRTEVAREVYQVPWKLIGPDQPAPTSGLVLYWFPASTQEVEKSTLRTSRDLSLFAAQCVSMEVADATWPIGAKLGAAGKTPMVVLADVSGNVVGRVEGENGSVKASAVEKLVRDEMKRREEGLKGRIEEAKAKSKTGDSAAAIEGLKAVWEERCLFPKKAKEAAKELKKLGAPVADEKEAMLFAPLRGDRGAEVAALMTRGLAAENAARYEEAGALYARAARLDPWDPTPARYLAEFHRHHSGHWKKARRLFEAMLERPIDPLARAVALHGLGKMTIHEGQFKKGLALFEASAAVYPLPLTYRNLAVYWNSEGDAVKMAEYVKKALDLDPHDPYNIIFATVFTAATDKEKALQIARENEDLLPASYNLAAIYAQVGERDKALAFLRRHFFEYERYQAVRAEEMMEARVDAVFITLRNDPEFLELTKGADGMLPMPMTAH
jgi:tetratricopeptide (TPR) repeat protein